MMRFLFLSLDLYKSPCIISVYNTVKLLNISFPSLWNTRSSNTNKDLQLVNSKLFCVSIQSHPRKKLAIEPCYSHSVFRGLGSAMYTYSLVVFWVLQNLKTYLFWLLVQSPPPLLPTTPFREFSCYWFDEWTCGIFSFTFWNYGA